MLDPYRVSPGGIPPTYNAVDGDVRLTRFAKSALPIVAAADRYYAQHGIYAAKASDLAPNLPSGWSGTTSDQIGGWIYHSTPSPAGYVLSRRLGWDPSLEYRKSNRGAEWAFEPGDGSPRKVLQLNPLASR